MKSINSGLKSCSNGKKHSWLLFYISLFFLVVRSFNWKFSCGCQSVNELQKICECLTLTKLNGERAINWLILLLAVPYWPDRTFYISFKKKSEEPLWVVSLKKYLQNQLFFYFLMCGMASAYFLMKRNILTNISVRWDCII